MKTIKQELKDFAKQLIESKIAIRTYLSEHVKEDPTEWLAKAVFNGHIFAIRRACDMLRDVSTDPMEIEALESKLMIQDLDHYRNA